MMNFSPESDFLPGCSARSGGLKPVEPMVSARGVFKDFIQKERIVSMKNSMRFLVLSLFVLCFAMGAFAQTSTTGSIEGTVTDPNGAAVPGATVTVTGTNLITPQNVTTDDQGRFRVLQLPPGRYTVSIAEGHGFAKYEKGNIEVNLSRTSSVDARLDLLGATASVTVSDTSGAAVDVTNNTSGTNVSSEQFSNFPTQRTVQSLYSIAPTVARSGLRDASGRERDPSVAGSSGPENNYILDGVNTTDPAFGGSGANLPFEFVQEVEIKTGAYGADYGKATGGIFNVITKSGSNEFHGDLFGYFTTKSFVREVKNFSFTGSAQTGFSEQDIGGDVGGPIIKDKLWFFGAFNPQFRKNFYVTQTFHEPVENKVRTPFYAGKLTWALNNRNVFTASTFADFTKVEGFLATAALTNVNGFGSDIDAFLGTQETGGHNYSFRLNSNLSQTWIGEFSGGLHFQRANTIPLATDAPQILDNFAVLSGGSVVPVTESGVFFTGSADPVVRPVFLDYVLAPGGSLQRNFFRGPGFGLSTNSDRNRYEVSARMQNIWGQHTFKYGFEWFKNIYNNAQHSSGPARTFGNPLGLAFAGGPDNNVVDGFRVNNNNFTVCTTRGTSIVCPTAAGFTLASAMISAAAVPGFTSAVRDTITADEALNNPFLIRLSTRVRDFQLDAHTYTTVQSAYVQDDFRILPNLQINLGVRWDYQQAYSAGGDTYLKLNDFISNTQPRIGLIWDFTGNGRGKLFANFARYVETPIPLDVNVRAGGGLSQIDKNFNVDRYSAPDGATIVPGISSGSIGGVPIGAVNLGSDATPIDDGLKPQTVNEASAGVEYEVVRDLALGFRGIYRAQDHVIEDGSFDDGDHYFLFNPGRRGGGTTEDLACENPAIGCFGRARRYYRALEFTATKRFSNNYQFIASYVFSSLIGNYEGLFRNDNGQTDPNITSLFDLVSLLDGLYGRLPNDRPHQFKFNGSYETPWKFVISGNFYAQSGVPFNELVPHAIYGNNEGFGVPRGTATVPLVPFDPNNPNIVDSVGSQRSPFTYNLDLGGYVPIKFGETKQLRFTVDWFNVFNSQRAVTLDQTFLINSGVSGVPPVSNPFYGSGVIFQFPSSLRLGAKFQF
jgi:outer membrane receptor protein involved in Fe transport